MKKNKENFNDEESSVITTETLPISIKNGALQFSSTEAFSETINKHNEMNEDEFSFWELENGFKSLKTEIDLAYKEMEIAEDSLELETIFIKNKDILTIHDDNIEPIIESSTYAKIVNRNGEYYIGNVLHKVLGNKIAISLNGDTNSVNTVLNENTTTSKSESSFKNKNLFVFEYTKKKKYGSKSSKVKSDAVSNTYTKGKRRIKLTMKAVELAGWGIYRYNGAIPETVIISNKRQMEVKISNYKKSWGKFRSYKTSCEMRNISYQLKGDYLRKYSKSYNHSKANTYTVTQKIWDRTKYWAYGDPNAVTPYVNQPVILKAFGEATNRGVGNNWVEVSR